MEGSNNWADFYPEWHEDAVGKTYKERMDNWDKGIPYKWEDRNKVHLEYSPPLWQFIVIGIIVVAILFFAWYVN